LTLTSNDNSIGPRRELGAAMRSFRKEVELDRDEAAALIDVSGVTLTRKEDGGQNTFKAAEVKELAKAYGVSDAEVEMLLELARQARTRKKRGEFPQFLPIKGRAFQEMERNLAVEIMVLTLSVIPLYFQTEKYMRQIWLRNGEVLAESHIEELVSLRKARQQVVHKAKPPKIRAVVHEFALRLPVDPGQPELMHEQLMQLAAACDLPHVEIQVQPMSAGAYPGMDSTFHMLRFPSGPADDMVQVYGYNETIYRDREAATDAYRVGWGRRQVSALELPESKALILDAAATFRAQSGS
jgi:DNA-binding XRE family transcriptional regulator